MEYLSQKAKIDWLRDGDENARLFHHSIKARRIKNQVYSITDEQGMRHEQAKDVSEAFLNYYKKLLRSNVSNRRRVMP